MATDIRDGGLGDIGASRGRGMRASRGGAGPGIVATNVERRVQPAGRIGAVPDEVGVRRGRRRVGQQRARELHRPARELVHSQWHAGHQGSPGAVRGADGVPRNYTSARLKTLGTFAQTYGRFEARIRIPRGQGIWPAFWMLGENVDTAGWPACGEIDIMENIGREPNIVHGTLHGPGYSGGQGPTASFTGPTAFADDFHVFAIEWEPATIRWYVDGNLYSTRNASDLPGGARWVFDHGFFILLNVAVGGDWPGNPDDTTALPQEMVVDWLRVYKR